ncbi:hypothetical protein [uncultured Campylobacter sp.]|uniref:TDE2712 family protein n=1 Tax=uncultured Campylobacter sp. TaxID=218934 RepID=UPI0026186D5A|nr:hypothetical protein [uncultured Campylobacter sp.]
MIKQIELNLETIESMLYLWTALAEKEKVAESFFVDVAKQYPLQAIKTKDFNEESVRRVLSAIQNRELLSAATKEEKRFWNNNMWMMEDLELPKLMAKPIKVLNVNHLIDELNKEFPNNNKEIFIKILNEDIDVWRPVKAVQIAQYIFKITDTTNFESELDEILEFKYGDIVKCREKGGDLYAFELL